jgi:hypothetical protein
MAPTTKDNRTGFARIKRRLVGKPIANSEDAHHRLKKRVALPVFASDAISSTAYATEEILIVFLTMAAIGMAAFDNLVPISIMVVVLLAIVVNSYRQTIHAYPQGGGSYIVAKDNLGKYPSLVSGASMLVDYILTVAVLRPSCRPSMVWHHTASGSALALSSSSRSPTCAVYASRAHCLHHLRISTS